MIRSIIGRKYQPAEREAAYQVGKTTTRRRRRSISGGNTQPGGGEEACQVGNTNQQKERRHIRQEIPTSSRRGSISGRK
jgi:xanthine/CO dehydrogenase XdhC/CoxF family maturation factor